MKRKVMMKLCVECCMIIMLMLMVTACGDRYIPVNDKTQGGTAQENKQNQQPGESLTETPASNEISPTIKPIREPVDVTIVPTEIPTPLPTKEPEPTPSDITAENRAKIDPALASLNGSGDCELVEVFFGDPYEAGQKMFLERYPEEYTAYYLSKEKGDLFDERTEKLATLGAELHNMLPLTWFQEQEKEFFENYPELKNCVPEKKVYMKLLLNIPYATMLKISKDSHVLMIRPYQDALEDSKPRVIGAYNGRNVYDVEISHEFDYAFDDAEHQGGDFFFKFDPAAFREMDDGDYLRIAFVLDADYELVNPLLQSEYDAITGNKPGYEEWLTSEDGMQALKKIELSLTETAAAAIRDNEWIYLGEGYDEAISQCRGCRYVMVLTTKAQLVEFIPELNQLRAGNHMPDKQSIDTNSLVYVYPAGIVEMMINDIPVGEQIR